MISKPPQMRAATIKKPIRFDINQLVIFLIVFLKYSSPSLGYLGNKYLKIEYCKKKTVINFNKYVNVY